MKEQLKHQRKTRVNANCNRLDVSSFTLVELLVVIAIIAILMAILLPALSKAKEMSRSSVCLNNLRQGYLSMSAYADDYSGYFPKAYFPNATTPWIKYLRDYNFTDKVSFCPSRESNSSMPTKKDIFGNICTYAFGTGSKHYRPDLVFNDSAIPPKRLNPSKTYLCGDAINFFFSSGQWSVYPATTTNLASQFPYFPFIHNRGANVLFWDSHVELKRYEERGSMEFMHLAGW